MRATMAPLQWLAFVVVASFVVAARAASLSGTLAANTTFELDAFVELATSKDVIRSSITRNATFAFDGLSDGQYLLTVHSRRAQFQMYSVEVTPAGDVDVRLFVVGQGALPSKPFKLPLVVPSVGEPVYFEQVQPFSLMRILKSNPMLLMGLVAVVCLAGLPKLLAALDPETAAEVQRNQAEMHAKLQSFGGVDLASTLSKRLAAVDDTPTSSPVSAGKSALTKGQKKRR